MADVRPACDAPAKYLFKASELVYMELPAAVSCALAGLLARFDICTSVRCCMYYWAMISLFFGRGPEQLIFNTTDAEVSQAQDWAWSFLTSNFSKRVQDLRSSELAKLNLQHTFHLHGHAPGPAASDADAATTILLYADSPQHFNNRYVAPFVAQLRCHAGAKGTRIVLDPKGSRVRHRHLTTMDVSIQREFYFSSREADDAAHDDAKGVLSNILSGRLEFTGQLPRLESTLALNYASSLHFGRAWAMAEHLVDLEPGALLIYFDSDVTVRPDSWRRGVADRLLSHFHGKPLPHVFIADTWVGTDCMNSGFVAVRNTEVGHLFLRLWKEKLWWSSSWDQAALAETVLELAGVESSKRSSGYAPYDHTCIRFLLPYQKLYMFHKYCDCYIAKLEKLLGPYRRRLSHIIGFVDPERLEMNYVANNLFHDHGYQLDKMGLRPSAEHPYVFRPLVVHWAGLGLYKTELVSELYSYLNASADSNGCMWAPPADENDQEEAFNSNLAPLTFGSYARQLRCCQQMVARTDKKKWPWNQEDKGWATVHWWGCREWQPLIDQDCERLFGLRIEYTNANA